MNIIRFFRSLRYSKARIQRARQFVGILNDSTCNLGGFGHNHHVDGGKIRERVSRVSIDRRHPLEKRYSQ